MKIEYRICPICKTQFVASGKRIYCTDECYKASKKILAKEWQSVFKHKTKAKKCNIVTKEARARRKGLHYADLQMAETIEMYARVQIGE